MTTEKKFNFIRPTLRFCIAGLLIPGFTAIIIFGFHIGLTLLGIECSRTWTILWTLTTIGALTAPVVFIRQTNRRLLGGHALTTDRLLFFNIIEYTLIQCTLAAFFTSGQTLCYVSDGQNGLEFVFTGWMALPFLVILSLLFDNLRERRLRILQLDGIVNQ